MSILLVAASPTTPSRTAAMLDATGQRLEALGIRIEKLTLREQPPEALVLADFKHDAIIRMTEQVARARIIIVATPIYKAAYSGLLKLYLDVLPQSALTEKIVLPIATGASPHHMLAIDYALRPVLQSMGARNILPGIFATDTQILRDANGNYQVEEEISNRLDVAVTAISDHYLATRNQDLHQFAPVEFSQVQCSY